MKSFVDRLFLTCVRYRNRIVSLWVFSNILLALVLVLVCVSIFVNHGVWGSVYPIGKLSGKIALIGYIVTTIPGMCRRFGISHKISSILMMFRRYMGISVFLFASIHSMIVRIVPGFAGIIPLVPIEVYVLFALAAYLMLFSLFVTSNDRSISLLGDWWGRLHDLTYVIVWLIFAHVAVQSFGIWSVLMAVASGAQISSHAYARFRRGSLQR